MNFKNTYQEYGIITKCLHLLVAILVIGMLTVGFLLSTIGSPIVYNLHKLTGLFVLLLSIVMMIWVILNQKPAYPITMPHWQRILAKSVQHTMLLLIFLMPLSGWIFTTAAGKAPRIFNITLALPGIPQNHSIVAFFLQCHIIIAFLLITFLSIHTIGALKHLLINRDGVFQRMFW